MRAIVRRYTFSIENVTLIRQRCRNAHRLGFAVHLAYCDFISEACAKPQSLFFRTSESHHLKQDGRAMHEVRFRSRV